MRSAIHPVASVTSKRKREWSGRECWGLIRNLLREVMNHVPSRRRDLRCSLRSEPETVQMPRERMTGPPRGPYTEPSSGYHGARDRRRTGKTGPGAAAAGKFWDRTGQTGPGVESRHEVVRFESFPYYREHERDEHRGRSKDLPAGQARRAAAELIATCSLPGSGDLAARSGPSRAGPARPSAPGPGSQAWT